MVSLQENGLIYLPMRNLHVLFFFLERVIRTIRPSRTGAMMRWLVQAISKQALFKVHSVSD